ncbi:cbb3-type cytochrome oxidase assembly protein CcoS [Planobacterium oryzisoli]|uniref:Cbb3-type cytochrome oxidase assembly protein CcoS n=1 Tax=Planobacterium oryzisoli TaxID=2771435 RepID=A0A931EB86_9FLAO|nr:cbb3-type cytochrome oxidase assembly protein CcoS [Planobacterium oryzisoli]MBF5027863.1 cbb3-type cytochrome oxidase assembly protein CcoS [Planobacterium oryzisoli]
MDILYLMIICSVSLAVIFLIVFIINARKGQFEDDESPAVRILFDDGVKDEKTVQATEETQETRSRDKENERTE